ncbi:MAG: hypothetical protein COV98_05545 [Candidatus Altarchaeum sp. CG12_big_fil_rev_8_21_14_0_65_33_22]|nr:hypothetical protein [Candidatus Altarchaeum hamiconexum]NCT00539.1 hypothetical protein [Candidatus Altarchaeum hamiconexum]OIQ05236.1 MAG: hypothetical protein AUK59_04650 [Candidatus Altarchaeum sp. CG2_30_32_3053]PIN66939.1 MAG: hypothetical protein COV98_05545 [Candidatus Altarchaeum sp. CG12_big_fil_rev_8_21_14_0_65_33_22]PIV27912.1 MAG: hypothetical protein COS36_04055 [Candidatus Altarchaeum sp. CG03_land_8_20_14_0_80_32_618]
MANITKKEIGFLAGRCYTCGKEINEDEAISYNVPSCCGVDEINVCKKCSELIKQGENEKCGEECHGCR